jgi:hypothetical protein
MLDLTKSDVSSDVIVRDKLFKEWDSFMLSSGQFNSVIFNVAKGEQSVLFAGKNQIGVRIERIGEHQIKFSVGHVHKDGDTGGVWVKHNASFKPKPKKPAKPLPKGALQTEVGEEEW